MKVLLVSNDQKVAGPVRANLFLKQYDQIVAGLRELGFQGEIPKKGLSAESPIVSGDYDNTTKIQNIQRAVHLAGHDPTYIDIANMEEVEEAIASGRFEKVFNYAEGLSWFPFNHREREIALLAEKYNVAHTGSHSSVARVVFDKHEFAHKLRGQGVPTPSSVLVVQADQYVGNFPVFAKPPYAGSGVGIGDNIARNRADLERIVNNIVITCFQPVMIQPLIEDARESTVALIPYQEDVVAFPSLNVHHSGAYGWNEKFGEDASKTQYSLEQDPDLCRGARNLAVQAYRALGMQGFARVDIMRNGEINVVEINQPAGLGFGKLDIGRTDYDLKTIVEDTKLSDFPKSVLAGRHNQEIRQLGINLPTSFVEIVNDILFAPTVRY